MSSNSTYIRRLIEQAKQGRKSQFVELSLEFLPRIYSIVFGLVPNMAVAKKICAEAFYIIWKRISLIKNDSEFFLQLKEIAIVRSFIYLRDIEHIELDNLAIEKLSEENHILFTSVEKEFLHLTHMQRVILILNDKLELPIKQISKVLKTLDEEEIRGKLHSGREVLLKKFHDGKLTEFPEHGWAILNDCLMKLDKGIDQYLEDEVVEFISEYLQQSKSLLSGIFSSITPDDEIVDYLKGYLLKEPTTEKAKKDLTSFSKNYTSVAANSKDVLFEKAFISPKAKTTYIKKNLSVNTSAKQSKLWIGFAVGFISIALLVYFFTISDKKSWNIKASNGLFTLDGNQNKMAELWEGAKIITKGNSNVELISNNSATIKLLANSNLILDEVRKNVSKFSLFTGNIKVNNRSNQDDGTISDREIIIIEANNLKISTSKGELSISSSKESGLDLNVISGFAEVKMKEGSYYLSENYRFIKTINNQHIIPYYKNTSRKLIELIKTINPRNIDKLIIMEIIKNSSKKDYLTLFNLFLISNTSNRELLLNKLNKYFPLKTLFNWNNLVNLKESEIVFFKNYLFENPF